jgi:phage shock protein A
MPLMNEELYRALLEAGASEDRATLAARSVAEHDAQLVRIEGRLAGLESRMTALEMRMTALESRMTLLMWALGLNVALTLAIMARLLR